MLEFLKAYTAEITSLVGLLAIIEWFFRPLRNAFRRKEVLTTPALVATHTRFPQQKEVLDVETFLRTQQKLRDELKAELEDAHADDKAQLQARIDALNARIAEPETALKEAQTRIADLERLLEREGNEIGAERMQEARDALEKGDYSIADDIFAEIETREAMAVERASRAAYGRGEVAEAEVRWLDAADHFQKAARLDPNYETLIKAGTYSGRAGKHREAIGFKEELVKLSRKDYGDEDERTAIAINNLAGSYHAAGRYEEAEPLYREALEIDRKALGEAHPSYAIRLNNLAGLLRDTGRYEDAEPLYREALEIDRKTLGEAHPDFAQSLNNLALLLKATGRYEEAEPLYREALGVFEAALGPDHPNTQTARKNFEIFLADRRKT